jgi:hypothetical protein
MGSPSFSCPLSFGVDSFSSEVFVFKPLAFWGCLFIHRRSLFLSPLHFGVASFFIGGLLFLSQRMSGLIIHLQSWLWLFERNSQLLKMELAWLAILTTWCSLVYGKGRLYLCFGVTRAPSRKNLTPLLVSPVRERVRSPSKCVNGNVVTEIVHVP